MLYFKSIFIIIITFFAIISFYSCFSSANRYAKIINEISAEYNVDPSVVFAVAEVESHYNPKAESKVGAIGIMQLMPKTATWIAQCLSIEEFKEEDLYDAQTNIRFGAWYLSYLYTVFKEDWQVFAAYNAGEGVVKNWIEDENFKKEDIPYSETAFYVKKVERAAARYAKKNFAAFD